MHVQDALWWSEQTADLKTDGFEEETWFAKTLS
jgi:hypothetical protein